MTPVKDFKTEIAEIIDRFRERNQRIKNYVDLYNLVDPQTQRIPDHTVTNFPQVTANLGISLLSNGQPKIRIPRVRESKAVQDKHDKTEQMLHGIERTISEQYRRQGEQVDRRRANANDLLVKGSVFNRVLVQPERFVEYKAGYEPVFIAERLDPETCYPVYTPGGIRRFVHVYKCSQDAYAEKKELLGLDDNNTLSLSNLRPGDEIEIKDYYWRERDRKTGRFVVYNCMYADDALVMKPDYAGGSEEMLTEIPVRGGSVFKDGRSFMHALLLPVSVFNRIYSYGLEGLRKQTKTIIVQLSERSAQLVDQDEIDADDFSIIPLQPGEDAKPMSIVQPFMAEFQQLIGIASGDMQRATFSFFLWGQLSSGTPPSGYAYNQMKHGAIANLGSHHLFLNALDGDTYRDWLHQYKEGDYSPIKVSGNLNGRGDGMFHDVYSRKDVPDFQYIEVDRPMDFPTDIIQQLQAAQMAVPGKALMSTYKMLDEILKVDDVNAMLKQMDEDVAHQMQLPFRIVIEMRTEAEGRLRDPDPNVRKVARAMLAAVDSMEQQLIQQTSGQAASARGGQGAARGTPSMFGNQGSPTQAELQGMTGVVPGQQKSGANKVGRTLMRNGFDGGNNA